MKLIRPVISILFIALILHYSGFLNSLSFVSSSQPEAGEASIDKPFDYNFKLKDLNGNDVDMQAYKGKVIFLNMWATWCGPCREEMPSIHDLYSKVDHEKIVFILLSLDTEDNRHKVTKYLSDKGFSFPVYTTDGSLPKQLQVSTIPTTFVVGSDGKIKLKKVGTANYATTEFQQFLQGLVAP